LTVVRSPLGQLFAEHLPAWRSRFARFGRTIHIHPPEHELPGDFDPTQLGFGLDAFVAWRAESAGGEEPTLAWRAHDRAFEISWHERVPVGGKGQGKSETSSSHARQTECTASMPLLLLARVAADHSGELMFESDPTLEVTLRWPQFRERTLAKESG
jgi:hypothetical protein